MFHGIQGATDLRIIVPAKDEEARIRTPLSLLCKYFEERARVLVVVNGSTDNTSTIVSDLQRIYSNLDLLIIDEAVGKGGAIRAGMRLGNEKFVGFIDADGSYGPEQVEALYQLCRREDVSAAIGSRRLPGARAGKTPPLKRQLASLVFRLITRLLFGLPYSDMQCGVKVFRRKDVDTVLDDLEIANFAFDIDLLLMLHSRRLKVVEGPVSWDDVPAQSKVRLFSAAKTMLSAVMRLRLKRGIWRFVPFADLVARSHVIATRPTFRIHILADSSKSSARVDELKKILVTQGHSVRIEILSSRAALMRLTVLYFVWRHSVIDAIFDCTDSSVWKLFRRSTKPIFAFEAQAGRFTLKNSSRGVDTVRPDLLNIALLVAQHRGYKGLFHSDGSNWILSRSENSTLPLQIVNS